MRSISSDVLVVGAGAAGISAALSAKDTGASVILIERNPVFGGEATNSSINSFCGFYTRGKNPDLAVGGVGKYILSLLKEHGFDVLPHPSKSTGNIAIHFDPEILKFIYDDLLRTSKIDFYLHTSLIKVNCENNQIISVIALDDEGPIEIVAKQYVDATGNANLTNLANLPTEWGDVNGKVQLSSLSFKLSNLPRHEILNTDLTKAIKAGKRAGIKYLKS